MARHLHSIKENIPVMKKTLLIVLLFSLLIALLPTHGRAQSVAINADSSLPDPSAILDIKSPKKGVLVPRMTLAQRNLIAVPAIGLLIYQTDNTPGFYYYDGGAWSPVKGSGTGTGSGPWLQKDTSIYYNSGHVAIGKDSAPDPLTIWTGAYQPGFSHRGPNGMILTSLLQGPKAFFGTVSNNDLVLGAGGFEMIAIRGPRYMGINALDPTNYLQVGLIAETPIHDYQIAFGDGTNSSGINQGTSAFWRSTTNMHLIPHWNQGASGSVGIGTNEEKSNRLQIGDVGNNPIAGFDLALGNISQATGFVQGNTALTAISTTDMLLYPKNATGHLGINSQSILHNTLEVGYVGGFSGNDIAFGNGTQVTGIAQTPNFLQIGSNTDMVFLPKYGTGNGRMGINTTTPRAPLDVVGTYSVTPLSGFYASLRDQSADDGLGTIGSPGPVPNLSIVASNNIYANEFDAYSDIRIKNLIGTSSRQQDYETINHIAIRDYTMKDKLKYGNHHFKKVIAQELEKFAPDLVSKHVDFIPNVYQITDTITKTENGSHLYFRRPHHLGDTAKKLEALLAEMGSLQTFNILSIPSPTEVVIDAKDITCPHIFVYGEQIPDFRTVDYEGLTTLNISATQLLSKEVKQLQQAMALANANILRLNQTIRKLANPNHLTAHRNTTPKTITKKTRNI
jgi:hypothetical protein